MNLQGSIANLQNSSARLYVEIAQCFKENSLIRDIWLEMARDKEQQGASLKSLPPQFWSACKKREEGLSEALQSCRPLTQCSGSEEHSLRQCITKTLEFEEPVILKVYAPLIRQLRTEWTDRALDFYIMVKAHVARLLRVVLSFSGDPILVQRAGNLLQSFEKEVQTPASREVPAKNAALKKLPLKKHPEQSRKASSRNAQLQAQSRSMVKGKRAQSAPPRSKPLVKNIELRRRRARG